MRIPMHRFKYTKLTKEQIGTKLKAAEGGPKSASAFSNALNGKALKIVTQNGGFLEGVSQGIPQVYFLEIAGALTSIAFRHLHLVRQ